MAVGSITGSTTPVVSTDPRDKNKDGKVTAQEDLAYRRAHPDPEKAAPKDAMPTEQANSKPAAGNSLLDISV